MIPALPIPNPQFGLSRQRLGVPEGYAGPQDRADLIHATNRLNEIRFNDLTFKQRYFLDAYIISKMDPLKAARDARLVPETEDDKTAIAAANRMIRKPFMHRAIEAALAWSAINAQIHAPDLINVIAGMAHGNMLDYLDPITGQIKLPLDDREKMARIKKIRVDEVKVGRGDEAHYVEKTSIELYDVVDAALKTLKLIGYAGAQDQASTQVNVQQNNTTNVAVHLHIVPVPSGQFLPAPEKPTGMLIEREPILSRQA